MLTSPTEAEILAFLHDVEGGKVLLSPVDNPQDIYTGEVVYFASNRWSITVSIEDNEWRRIDGLSTADGRERAYQEVCGLAHVFETYRPSDEVAWIHYGIPGWRLFRCMKCSQSLPPNDEYAYRPAFHCIECGPFLSHLSDSDIRRLLCFNDDLP